MASPGATEGTPGQDCGNPPRDVLTSSLNMVEQEGTTNPGVSEPKTGETRGRKSKACAECKKMKIKCEISPGDAKCRGCQRRNLNCMVTRTFQTLLNNSEGGESSLGLEQKVDLMREDILDIKRATVDSIQDEIQQVKDSLQLLTSRLTLLSNANEKEHEPSGMLSSTSSSNRRGPTMQETPSQLTSISPTGLSSTRLDYATMAMTRENSVDGHSEEDQAEAAGPVTLEEPMESLYEVTRLRNIRSNKAKTTKTAEDTPDQLDDFISRGVISEYEAEELYNVFHATLNHYLWVGLEQIHSSFNSVRQSSELLTATVLTVTALHIPTSAETFDACYREFLHLISSSMFSRYHSVDDVRGLCIAAFWLSDVSWKLSGHAIRIATELNLHQSSCFVRALEGDRESFFKARLWYMLYVCDHHFSIAYGRPPMIAESFQIREHELFLSSPLAGPLDTRILSQVSLMQILTRLYDRFSEPRVRTAGKQQRQERNESSTGANAPDSGLESSEHFSSTDEGDVTAAMLLESDLDTLRAYNLEIDHWRMRWFPRQPPSPFIGTFTNKGVILYSYFAKLQINSLAVRGVPMSGCISTQRKELINLAVLNAETILTFVLEEEDIRRALVGTPLYVHAMITVACVFLMKVMTKWNRLMGLNVDRSYVWGLLERMVTLLKSAVTSDRHVLKHIASGLIKMLDKMKSAWRINIAGDKDNASATNASTQDPTAHRQPAANSVPYSWGLPATARHDQNRAAEQSLPPSLLLTPSNMQGGNFQSISASYWNPGPYTEHMDDQRAMEMMEDYPMMMDDSFVYEAFGADDANDVYNLLSSQFFPN
ncbi:hypothetical protein FOQG_16388 [Fusarium oxysporum f. sp. raphani 54005]|uniref:Zn(2)-C6 fungal-type domain-containing protein n=1 Tax=Fusarium oxysporum f. sp. raphani 54005 TaxID=1089458 RepID=X0BKH4_FUSOX|nr:hypothetical protein FOQG_16388 [Fusarium oxysporum f. sp. raphani 54005]